MESTGSYVFAGNELSAEERRLDLLEELYDRESQRLLDLIELERGGRFLEVGAGHGSLVSFMLARCGARGQVVATDIDTRFVDQMTHPRLSVRHHDLLTDDVGPLGLFDVVHARFVLHHLGERAADGLGRLVSLLAPGGRVLVEDPLWDNRYDPSYPNAATLQAEDDEFEVAARAAGLDLRVSGRFPRLLVDLGLTDVASAINSCVHRGGDLYSRFIHASIPASSEAISYNAIFEEGTEQLANILLDPDLFYIGWHHLAVWGTRPR